MSWGRTWSSRGGPRRAEGGGPWAFAHVDVTDEAAVGRSCGGRRSSAAPSTGWSTPPAWPGGGPVHMLPAGEWARVIAVNLTGTFLTAKHVIAQMLRSRRGRTASADRW